MYTEDNEDFSNNYEENYGENDDKYPYTKLIIRIVIIFLCLLLAIWLISKLVNGSKVNKKNDGTVFNNNVRLMHDASEKYFFVDDNLPKNTNDAVTISLKDLKDSGKIDVLYDYQNKACSTSTSDSYATMTKTENFYEMKMKLTCSEEQKDFIYYYDLRNSDKQVVIVNNDTNKNDNTKHDDNNNKDSNNTKNDNDDLNINCDSWTEWTTKKIDDTNLLVRTRTLVKAYKLTGSEKIIYGPWSEWTTSVISKTDNLDVETKNELVSTWSESKTTTNKISNSDTIKVISTNTINGEKSCYNKTVKEKITGELSQGEYTNLEAKGLIVSLVDSYWKKVNGNYSKVYKAVYYKTETKKVCSTSDSVTTYVYQELVNTVITKYRSRSITKGIDSSNIVYTDYLEKIPQGYTKVAGSELIQYSYKDSVCK